MLGWGKINWSNFKSSSAHLKLKLKRLIKRAKIKLKLLIDKFDSLNIGRFNLSWWNSLSIEVFKLTPEVSRWNSLRLKFDKLSW